MIFAIIGQDGNHSLRADPGGCAGLYVADTVKARRMAALRGLYAMGQEAEARGEVTPDWRSWRRRSYRLS